MRGHTGIFLKLLVGLSVITTLGHAAFQVTLVAMPPYAHFLKLLRHMGLVRIDFLSYRDVIVWLSPEILMLVISVAFLVTLRKLTAPPPVQLAIEEPSNGGADTTKSTSAKEKRSKSYGLLVSMGRFCVLFALCTAAVLRPSVPGGLYFIIFLCTATWWAGCKQLRRGFAVLMLCLAPVVVAHLYCLYAYQLHLASANATTEDSNSTVIEQPTDPRVFVYSDLEWAAFVNPIAIYVLFYLIILEAKELLKPELIRGVSPSKRHGSGKRSGIYQDSIGSVTVTGDNTEDIPLDEMGTTEHEYEPTVLENVFYAVESIAQLIVRSSYIGTNIIMMAWSITYLSWLTFILLIWANLIWLVPNQRRSMLRSSPFLVLYAWFLLISAYIYSMDGMDLAEIGFVKVTRLPCAPLFVKCLYTAMFWVTLRQYIQERAEQRHSSALADMAAPLQITVGAASAGTSRNNAAGADGQEKTGSKVMERIGQHLKRFLTKFWIWVVAITLFAVAITGQRMTGFRILYMALFLIFILSFQFSFQIWRKMMFGFWLTVIIYSMIILVMVYTYQFKNFPKQLDIGLEQFETTQLFVRLVTPTFFVIITVIQLHYFHNDFMVLSDPKNTNQVDAVTDDLEQSSMQGGAYVDRSEKEEPSSQIQFDLYDLDNITSAQFQLLLKQWLKRLHRVKNLCYLFLELHMSKAVLLFAMLMCVYDKCALYFVIVVLISLALTFGRPMQTFAIYFSSLLVSIMLLSRMIYQIQYITPQNWDVNCTVTENPELNMTTKNNAPWFGFEKGSSLPSLVKWNITYILVVTLWAVILVRQYNYRLSRGRPTTRAFFMFPNIKRTDADTNLRNCLKYLANYGYYKFGVEISLMMTVAVIGTRMDMYSVLYAIWLCILFSMKRSTLSKVWLFYLIFLAIALPFQYFMAVGLPPTLCQEFPWDRKDQLLHSLQDWAYLLDNYHPPPVKKLVLDFILLLLVSRQWVVFRIEKRYGRAEYAGGSNEVIIHHAEEKDFKNPVPDFITYARSYLDIFKRAVLQSFLWITLAIVFLAGTNRTNIFSLGYLVGAFVFLWHGSDFYLKPIPKILKQWQWLLGYNVSVIFIKTAFQILGCIFIHDIPTNCCWLVQLLGIGCVRKFGANLVEPSVIQGPVPPGQTEYCTVPREFIGIAWDGLCFGLLIMQRRIFHSYNFFHIVDECKATTILASRGAELIEEIRQKMVHNQEEQEHRVLEKIKMKMDRIKANQQKIQDSVKGKRKYRIKPPIDEHDVRSVRIQEEPETEEEPQPGTSKDEDISELTESKETIGRKILQILLFIWAFLESSMISLTNFLNRYSRDYRYVLKENFTDPFYDPSRSGRAIAVRSAYNSPTVVGHMVYRDEQIGNLVLFYYFLESNEDLYLDYSATAYDVLLKCIFQFDILQGGSSVLSNVDADPLMPTKLLGLYRKEAYAMVMLKSLGIWTTSPPTSVAILSDGEYRLEDGQLIPIGSSSPRTESDVTHQDTPNSAAKSRNGSKSSSGRSSPGEEILSIEVKKEVPFKHYSRTVQLGFAKYGDGFRLWLHQLLDPTSRVAADVYSLMFLCDFINFFVILVPVLFLFMLILQFMLIVIDRGIYLRKNILAKIIFQFLQIILLHIWLFIVFPVITGSKCNTVLPPQIYYMVKCFYLLLSAYQIRCGYPTRILGNFLCKGYGYVNMFCFKGFMLVPFLFELRTCMDWMWTETSMTVFDWIKMEDIFAHIFLLKCQRHAEDEFPQPRGEKKNPLPKYLMGGAMLAVIIGIIWFPLVFFSLGNAVGETNVPFKPEQLDQLRMVYNNFKSSGTFINNYEAADIAAVKLSIDSGNIWGISPPDRKRMVAEINSSIIRKGVAITLPAETEDRANLLKMLEGLPADPVLLQYLLPKFIKKAASLRNLTTNLNKTGEEEWWRIREECNDTNYELLLRDLPYQDCSNSIILYTFNDKCGKIMFEDLPNVDRVLQLCLDIYLVREACEFALEEDLFAKLVFLFSYLNGNIPQFQNSWLVKCVTKLNCIANMQIMIFRTSYSLVFEQD
nr:unnamed protein product [Callosobruchus analis]